MWQFLASKNFSPQQSYKAYQQTLGRYCFEFDFVKKVDIESTNSVQLAKYRYARVIDCKELLLRSKTLLPILPKFLRSIIAWLT